MGPCSGCEQQRDCLVGSGMVPSGFGDESNYAGGNCHGSTVWLGSSLVIVLARSARGLRFESRSGHVLFPPLLHLVAQSESVLGLRAAKGLSRRFRHGSEQIRGRI